MNETDFARTMADAPAFEPGRMPGAFESIR
jgi:hypothetical protein